MNERRPRPRRLWLLLAPAALLVIFAVSWTKLASSSGFCASCHKTAAASGVRSVHADVPCIACHRGSGATGALAYLPTFAREAIQQLHGPKWARGVMKAAPCASCHANVATSALVKEGHPDSTSVCLSCHGEVAHPAPSPTPPSGSPHPPGWVQAHGKDASPVPDSCASCHGPEYCSACHARASFPHAADWIKTHGKIEEARGPKACALCHPPTFCKGCHGTEIPHRDNWLSQHPWVTPPGGTSACLVCHARSDCATCHARHIVHRQQRIYEGA